MDLKSISMCDIGIWHNPKVKPNFVTDRSIECFKTGSMMVKIFKLFEFLLMQVENKMLEKSL